MAKVIRIDTSMLQADAENIKERIESIRSQIRLLEDHAAVLDGMWDGPSSEVFTFYFRDYLSCLDKLLGNVESINQYECSAYGKFNRCGVKVKTAIEELDV